ncbi:MAG: hypothetical protein AAGF31_03060 [Planctomycetota bacterium]
MAVGRIYSVRLVTLATCSLALLFSGLPAEAQFTPQGPPAITLDNLVLCKGAVREGEQVVVFLVPQFKPEACVKTITETIEVPETQTKTVIVDGREKTVEYTITKPVTVEKTVDCVEYTTSTEKVTLAVGAVQVWTLDGRRISGAEISQRLKRPTRILALCDPNNAEAMDPYYRNVLSDDLLLVYSDQLCDVLSPPGMMEPDEDAFSPGPIDGPGAVSADGITPECLVCEYARWRQENDWHQGEITFDSSDSSGRTLRWTCRQGTSWTLKPDLENDQLITGRKNPYQNDPGGKTFALVKGEDAQGMPLVVGFRFNGDLFLQRNALIQAEQALGDCIAMQERNQSPDRIVAKLREVVRLNPVFPPALEELALMLEQRRQPAEAADLLTRAIEIDPENAGLYYNRAIMQLDQRRERAALEDINQAIDLRRGEPGYHQLRSEVYQAMGNRRAADADRREAERLDALQRR